MWYITISSLCFFVLYIVSRHANEDNWIYRPANILISSKNVPVLVDFGFAEKYDMDSDTAFHSNLSYGTPEVTSAFIRVLYRSYLCP